MEVSFQVSISLTLLVPPLVLIVHLFELVLGDLDVDSLHCLFDQSLLMFGDSCY